MRGPLTIRSHVDAGLARLEQEHVVEVALDDLEGLLREPELPTFAPRRGPRRAGIEDVALTLAAAKVQPDDLTVRAVVSGDVAPSQVAEAQAAMCAVAKDAANAAWREAKSIRNMGLRQLPYGIVIAVISALVAYGFGYLGGCADSLSLQVLCFTV